MPFSDRVQQLDREIAATLERVVSDLRRELTERVRAGSSEILRRFEEFRPELPARFLSPDHVSPVAEEAAAAARRAALGELRDALAAVDAARSQSEVLQALLRESGRFASRSALLLLRGGELRGWGAHGFAADEAAVRGVALGTAGGAWGRFAEGRGALRLEPADGADLCSALDSPLPREAALVPLVLRDRLAAGLYADVADGGELQVEALQSLAYAAAQAIELLPLRERAATATLHLLDAAPAAPAVPAAPADQSEPAAPPEEQPESAPEPAAGAAAEAPVEATAEPQPATSGSDVEVDESWTVEPIEDEPAAAAAPEPAEPRAEAQPASAPDAGAAEAPAEEETSFARTAELSIPPGAAAGLAGSETVLLPRPGQEPREEPRPAAPLRPVPAAGLGTAAIAATTAEGDESRSPATSEVRPPSGIQGPGWAFATTRVPVSADDEALHEEARRLARLLVSEIKLYNEEQVDEGRRNRDVYERLKDDIDRSRQMYEERVEPRVLGSTDYFYQELVRILAAGDPKALGI